MSVYVGIDLGTTNTVVAVYDCRSAQPELKVLRMPQPGRTGRYMIRDVQALPSAVYFHESEVVFVGEYARALAPFWPNRVVKSIKTLMGQKCYRRAGERDWKPEEISGHILAAVRKILIENYGINTEEAVITVPASFNTDQREATINAARIAGFRIDDHSILDEPTAALLYFLHEQARLAVNYRDLDFSKPRHLMVYDLGGGTLDVSILRVEQKPDGNLKAQALARSRYTSLGGDDFDLYVAAYILQALEQAGQVQLSELSGQEKLELAALVLGKAEELKKELVRLSQNKEMLAWIGMNDELKAEVVLEKYSFIFSCTEEQYYEMVAPLLRRNDQGRKNLQQPILEALEDAGLTAADLDRVFLTGGMTRLPVVRQVLQEVLPGRPLQQLNADQAVALGAAIHQRNLKEGLQEIEFIDQLGETIFLRTRQGFSALIEKNLQPPARGESRFLARKGTDRAEIVLYRGRSATDPYKTPLNRRTFLFDEELKADTEVRMFWEIDQNKKIVLKAELQNGSGQQFQLEVDKNYLSDDEITRIREEMNLINPEVNG